MLKWLINDICDHLDDEHMPPSTQDLRNNKFFHGFRAGYREAYRQWGVEVEESMDEVFKEGKEQGHREEKENWVSNHGEALCASLEVSMPQTQNITEAGTQVAPMTAKTASQMTTPTFAAMQTAIDVPPHLLNDAGMS
jgi:flagellar biosynthesis/type III secretory pathway protein FliH